MARDPITMNLRSDSGWSVIDTSQFAGVPGVHDLGTLLGVTTGSLWLVILRAADRWVPNDDGVREQFGTAGARVMLSSNVPMVRRTC